ncbi:MAG TPA: SCO family protein [Chitinophagaceae bacterium]|nr:SCO family protein [Chitinophagaceae bacterium]
MSKKTTFYFLFFGILVIGFYFIMSYLIPDFAKSKFEPIGRLLPFSFTNQDGKTVTENDVEGKVFVAEYFFTTCPSICPRMNTNMKKVYEQYKDEENFLILSHTCDPETDSAQQLKKYADSLGVKTTKWIFLTGRKDSLYFQARNSYKIDDPNNNVVNIDDDFLHSQFFALVDKKGRVKKIYDGIKQSEVDEMIIDIKQLLRE